MIMGRINFIFLLITAALFCSSPLFAQQRKAGINISHKAFTPTDLPFPGTPLKISAILENTKNSQLAVRGFFVRDGKIIEQNLTDFSTNESDQLVYSTTVNAPLAELNYQFVVLDGQTPVTLSKRYSIRRSCIPKIESIPSTTIDNPIMKEKIAALQEQATSIQNEVQNYETAIKLLEELKVLTEK